MTFAPVAPFRLSSELAGHSADVRALAARSMGETSAVLFSSSRDGTARSWITGGDTADWKEGPVFSEQHDGFVSAVEYINSTNSDAPGGQSLLSLLLRSALILWALATGYLATGGQDKLIQVWPLSSNAFDSTSNDTAMNGVPTEAARPSHTLIGHEDNVCALHASSDGKVLVSGSWDK